MPVTTVAVLGAGASGTLACAQLARAAARAGTPVDAVLVDPRPQTGRGVAYGTADRRHLLNVPASGMSAYPDDPGHFLRWLAAAEGVTEPYTFAPREAYGRYLGDVLAEAVRAAGPYLRVRRVRDRATALTRAGGRATVRLASGASFEADAVVLALGNFAPDGRCVPPRLRGSRRFVPDAWAPGAMAAVQRASTVIAVGTGLTMVDVVLSVDDGSRVVHAVSRNGLLPTSHAERPRPPVPFAAPAGGGLAELRAAVRRHLDNCRREHGDWRPALDGLRGVTNDLWCALSEADQRAFLAEDSASWRVHRHRTAPHLGARLEECLTAGRLQVHRGEVVDAVEHPDHVLVTLSDGREIAADVVVDCTGPVNDVGAVEDPLVASLLAQGLARPGPHRTGFDTTADGRLREAGGEAQDWLWTLGPTRRGGLLETTAVPEIRCQAAELAELLVAAAGGGSGGPGARGGRDARGARPPRGASGAGGPGGGTPGGAPPPPRGPASARPAGPGGRPTDPYGLPLSTTAEAAGCYGTALDRILRVQSGAEEALAHAVARHPGFALGHAALALLGQEWGADVDVAAELAAAERTVSAAGDDRERSFVAVVGELVRSPRKAAAGRLIAHIQQYPRDALAVSVAVPTIAFSGLTELPEDTWQLVEGLAPHYGTDWWYAGLLAFIRQEQERWDEAAELAERALADVPSSGHAVHARAHVHYETGDHEAGLAWLDPWVTTCGRGASHRAHFSWHAALHELAMGDGEAVRRRYAAQLAPPAVTGVRALVDSASLLWRSAIGGDWSGKLPIREVLESTPHDVLECPATAFAAFHTVIALAAAHDADGIRRVAAHAARQDDPVQREVIVPLADAFTAIVEGRHGEAADRLAPLLCRLGPVGGSAAQREVVEDTLVYVLAAADRCDEARRILTARLDRRPSPRDRRELARLGQSPAAPLPV